MSFPGIPSLSAGEAAAGGRKGTECAYHVSATENDGFTLD